MAGLNKVMIIGNVGRDPETTYTQGGVAVTKITIATSETWNDKTSGEKKEKTEWHRITFFGKQAETIGRYVSKGSQLYVEGKIQTSQYEKDGITRYSTDIIANVFQFLGGKKQDGQQSQQQQPQGGGGFQTPQQQQFQQGQQDMQYPGNGGFQSQGNNQSFQNQGNQGFSDPAEDD